MGKHLSSEFKVIKVLSQVDAIVASLLFNAVLETAIGRSKVKIRGNIFDKCSQIMACADDVVIVRKREKCWRSVYISGRINK